MNHWIFRRDPVCQRLKFTGHIICSRSLLVDDLHEEFRMKVEACSSPISKTATDFFETWKPGVADPYGELLYLHVRIV
jgi:hypothetical protein